MIATWDQVRYFLSEFCPVAAAKAVSVAVDGDREENRAFLKKHGLNTDDVNNVLELLEVEDYWKGPEPDDNHRPCSLWFFGPDFCSQTIYVKIADWKPQHPRFRCVSFHEPKYPIPVLPYRK